MAASTRTGEQLLDDFGIFLDDKYESTTTGAGDTTTVVDTALAEFGTDRLIGMYIRITANVAGNQYLVRRITAFVSATGTVTVAPAFAGATGSATTYELHRYDPEKKFRALDEARIEAVADLYQLIYDETLTTDGIATEYPVPSSIRHGPMAVQIEQPVTVDTSWNFIQDPRGDSLTNWTAASTTATVVTRAENDRLIPKYDQSATKLATATVTNGTYKQPVASMTNSITAALAGGRQMTFAAWVYSRVASRVALTLEDGTDTTTGTAHRGLGWELITVTKEIADANATTLTAGFDITNDTGAVDCWWNHSWLYFGDATRVTGHYPNDTMHRVRRDATTQNFHLPGRVRERRQLRLIGKDILSALRLLPHR